MVSHDGLLALSQVLQHSLSPAWDEVLMELEYVREERDHLIRALLKVRRYVSLVPRMAKFRREGLEAVVSRALDEYSL